MFRNPSLDSIRDILHHAKSIAVVGLSDNPLRTSYHISELMQSHGYQIFPVNPMIEAILSEYSYASVLDLPQSVDIINVFRNSEALYGVVEEAIQTDCPVIWAQQGVYDEEAAQLAHTHGKIIIMDLCISIMYNRLIGSS